MTTVSGIKNIQQEMDANVMSRGKTTPLRILFVDMLRNDAFAGTGIGANKWVNTAADGAAKDLLNREPTSSTTRGRRTVQAGDTTDEEITSPLRQETEIRIGQRRLKDCCTRLKGRDVKWKNTGYIVTYLPPIPPWPPPISHCIPLTTKRKRLKEQPHKCKQLQLRGKGTRNALQQAGYALGITQSKMHLFIGWIELENLPTSQPPTHPLIRPLGARWNDERILSTILASCLNSGRRSSTKLVRTGMVGKEEYTVNLCLASRRDGQQWIRYKTSRKQMIAEQTIREKTMGVDRRATNGKGYATTELERGINEQSPPLHQTVDKLFRPLPQLGYTSSVQGSCQRNFLSRNGCQCWPKITRVRTPSTSTVSECRNVNIDMKKTAWAPTAHASNPLAPPSDFEEVVGPLL